jgi:HEAT repeat protein
MSVFARQKVSKLARKSDVRGLIEALGDDDLDRRAEAAHALGKIGGPQAIDALIEVLDKKFTRDTAILTLGSMGAPAVEPLLHAFGHGDNDWVRAGAAQALGLTGDPRAAGPLIDALGDEVMHQVADWALEAMGEGAVDPLVRTVQDGDAKLAEQVIPILQRIGGDRVTDALFAVVGGDNDGAVRAAAAEALGRIGGDRALEALFVLVGDHDGAVRASAAWWLGVVGGDQAAEVLLGVLRDDGYMNASDSASRALASFGGQRAVEGLLGLVDDRRGDVRVNAVRALGGIGGDRAQKYVIGGDRAHEALLDALSDDNRAVREMAELYLDTQPSSASNEVIEALLGALQSDDESARQGAGAKLAKIATNRGMTTGTHGLVSVEGVSKAMWDTSLAPSVRRSSARALTDLFAGAGFQPRASGLEQADMFESEQPCSSCGRRMLQHKITSQMDVVLGAGLFGNVCFTCSKVYCDKCIKVGYPTPCPICGTPTKPAGREELAHIGVFLAPPDGAVTVGQQTPVLDLRSAEEIAGAERARQPLDQTDEALACEMCQLIDQADQLYGKDDVAYRATCALMHSIGERLGEDGGSERMSLVAYRVQALGGRVRDCEQQWAGICGWQA